VEPDDAGLQPQAGAEPGELREIDGGSRLKEPRTHAALEVSRCLAPKTSPAVATTDPRSGQRPPTGLSTLEINGSTPL
jgi:hypothetical protein